jgi:hypothetical protein
MKIFDVLDRSGGYRLSSVPSSVLSAVMAARHENFAGVAGRNRAAKTAIDGTAKRVRHPLLPSKKQLPRGAINTTARDKAQREQRSVAHRVDADLKINLAARKGKSEKLSLLR